MVYLMLIIGLSLLVWGGNLLVDGSVGVAKKMGLSSLVIGLVLVGFGTSTPELLASLLSVLKGSNGIALGNVIGSNIANILLVLGAAAVIHPVKIDIKDFKRDGFFLMLASIMVVASVYFGARGIKKFRHALLAGILADIVGLIAAIWICAIFFL